MACEVEFYRCLERDEQSLCTGDYKILVAAVINTLDKRLLTATTHCSRESRLVGQVGWPRL